jgi:tRNA threonylcarbamoyl adenosine modification protein YeaZ
MNILSIDTSAERGGLSLLKSNGDIYRFEIENTQRVAENIYRYIDELMSKSGTSLKDIELFATVLGPGSFTGLRVSLSVVKAFSLALHRRIFGVETFRLMAFEGVNLRGGSYRHILPVGNARRGEYFISGYDTHLVEIMPIRIVKMEEIKRILIENENALVVFRDEDVRGIIPSSQEAVLLDKDLSYACLNFAKKYCDQFMSETDPSSIEPVYVRNDVVRLKV